MNKRDRSPDKVSAQNSTTQNTATAEPPDTRAASRINDGTGEPVPDLSELTPPPPPEKKEKEAGGGLRHTFTAPALVLFVYILLLLTERIDYTAAGSAGQTYLSLVAVQLLVFMLPSVFYIRYRQTDVREELRLRPPAPDKIMFAALCSLILIITSTLIGAAQGDYTGSVYSGRILIGDAGGDTAGVRVYYAICFALVPAICEELLFRGIIMSEYQRTSVPAAIVINSLFFSMLHFDLANFPFYFISGLVLSMCAYAANSIVASAAAHICYNLFALFGGELVTRIAGSLADKTLVTIVLFALLLIILALTFGECERIYRSYAKANKDSFYVIRYKNGEGTLRFFSALLSPVSLACIVMFIIVTLLQK